MPSTDSGTGLEEYFRVDVSARESTSMSSHGNVEPTNRHMNSQTPVDEPRQDMDLNEAHQQHTGLFIKSSLLEGSISSTDTNLPSAQPVYVPNLDRTSEQRVLLNKKKDRKKSMPREPTILEGPNESTGPDQEPQIFASHGQNLSDSQFIGDHLASKANINNHSPLPNFELSNKSNVSPSARTEFQGDQEPSSADEAVRDVGNLDITSFYHDGTETVEVHMPAALSNSLNNPSIIPAQSLVDGIVSVSEETPLLRGPGATSITSIATTPKRAPAWLSWIIITVWALFNIAIVYLTYIMAHNMSWDASSLITAVPIFGSAQGIFRYLAMPLSLTQAKSVDFAVSAVIAPLLIANANFVWFKLGRVLSRPGEEGFIDPNIDSDTDKLESGSYDLGLLTSLLKNWTTRKIFFAILVLSSALASTFLSNALAYKALPGTPIKDGEEISYQLVYIPGLVLLALFNVSIASVSSLGLVFSARKANAAQKKQHLAATNEGIANDSILGLRSDGLSTPVNNIFTGFSFILPNVSFSPWFPALRLPTFNRVTNLHERQPLLPVVDRVEAHENGMPLQRRKWTFFKARSTISDSNNVPNPSLHYGTHEQATSVAAKIVAPGDLNSAPPSNLWRSSIWSFGYPKGIWKAKSKDSIRILASVDGQRRNYLDRPIIAESSSRASGQAAGLNEEIGAIETDPLLETGGINGHPPHKIRLLQWWTFKSLGLPSFALPSVAHPSSTPVPHVRDEMPEENFRKILTAETSSIPSLGVSSRVMTPVVRDTILMENPSGTWHLPHLPTPGMAMTSYSQPSSMSPAAHDATSKATTGKPSPWKLPHLWMPHFPDLTIWSLRPHSNVVLDVEAGIASAYPQIATPSMQSTTGAWTSPYFEEPQLDTYQTSSSASTFRQDAQSGITKEIRPIVIDMPVGTIVDISKVTQVEMPHFTLPLISQQSAVPIQDLASSSSDSVQVGQKEPPIPNSSHAWTLPQLYLPHFNMPSLPHMARDIETGASICIGPGIGVLSTDMPPTNDLEGQRIQTPHTESAQSALRAEASALMKGKGKAVTNSTQENIQLSSSRKHSFSWNMNMPHFWIPAFPTKPRYKEELRTEIQRGISTFIPQPEQTQQDLTSSGTKQTIKEGADWAVQWLDSNDSMETSNVFGPDKHVGNSKSTNGMGGEPVRWSVNWENKNKTGSVRHISEDVDSSKWTTLHGVQWSAGWGNQTRADSSEPTPGEFDKKKVDGQEGVQWSVDWDKHSKTGTSKSQLKKIDPGAEFPEKFHFPDAQTREAAVLDRSRKPSESSGTRGRPVVRVEHGRGGFSKQSLPIVTIDGSSTKDAGPPKVEFRYIVPLEHEDDVGADVGPPAQIQSVNTSVPLNIPEPSQRLGWSIGSIEIPILQGGWWRDGSSGSSVKGKGKAISTETNDSTSAKSNDQRAQNPSATKVAPKISEDNMTRPYSWKLPDARYSSYSMHLPPKNKLGDP